MISVENRMGVLDRRGQNKGILIYLAFTTITIIQSYDKDSMCPIFK